jgi:uncharacterized repeat protein (TIGR03803 family)
MRFPRLLQALSLSVTIAAASGGGLSQALAADNIRRGPVVPLLGLTESVVYTFPKLSYPFGPLATDSKGNIYGALSRGPGGLYSGSIFKLTPSATGYSESTIFKFNKKLGFDPRSGVIADRADNIYTTTSGGGLYGYGAIFRIPPVGTATTLYNFKSASDGESPSSLTIDAAGNLYGTTSRGGAYGAGTVYELSASGVKTTLHSFGAAGDGQLPFIDSAGSLLLENGVLYGTTEYHGAYFYGTVWAVTLGGKETILHSFRGAPDGAGPTAGLISDGKNNLFGTTAFGGRYGRGSAFIISPSGQLTIIHNFGDVGHQPNSLMLYGNILYGTTFSGTHPAQYGTAFELQNTPSGYAAEILHEFGLPTGRDGSIPSSGLTLIKGKFYGITQEGGEDGGGTIYELTPK